MTAAATIPSAPGRGERLPLESSPGAGGAAARPAVNPWLIAVVVTMATFMEVLDTTIMNVALKHIAGNLSAGEDESTWVLTSYLVSNAIILPLSGWLSSVIGRKRFYMTCVGLFTVSSFLCGFAPNLGALVFFRVIQGLGGGGLQPSEQAILVDTFPPNKRGMAFAISGIALVTAPVLGPTLGGWITDNFSWRWCFYVNVPVGALSLLLTYHLVHDPPHARAQGMKGRRVDFVGLALIAIGLGCLQVVLDKGERLDWLQSNFIRVFASVSFVCIGGAIAWVLNRKDPVVDLRLLKEKNFAMANVLMMVLGFVMFGSTVLLPQMVQSLMGYTATEAGLVLSPGGLVVIALMPLVGFLVSRVQPRWLIALGLFTTGFSTWWMSGFNLQLNFSYIMTVRCFQAAGLAFLFVPINTVAYSKLPPGKNNNASALINLSRNLGASFGIAGVTTFLSQRTQFHQERLVSHLSPFNPALRGTLDAMAHNLAHAGLNLADAVARAPALLYNTVQRQAAMLAYLDNFWVLGVVFLWMIPTVLLIGTIKPGKAAMGH